MNQHQMAMMQRMRLQQNPGMMRGGDQMPNMMQSNGGGMEMMGPNGMMMRNMPMGGMPRTSGHPMMQGPGNGMMHGMNMMGPGHPGNHPNMSHGMPGNRPPPPEYHSQQVAVRNEVTELKYFDDQYLQGGQNNMPYMMGGQMGMGSGPNNMRMTGPPRNAGMQQIPPSGPMMRAQVGHRVKMIIGNCCEI